MHRCFVRLFPLLRLGCPLSAPPTGPPRRRRVYHAGNLPFVVEAEANNVVVLHFPLSSASGAHFRPTIGHPRLKSVEHAGICLALWGMKATTAVFLHVLLSSASGAHFAPKWAPEAEGCEPAGHIPSSCGETQQHLLVLLACSSPPPPGAYSRPQKGGRGGGERGIPGCGLGRAGRQDSAMPQESHEVWPPLHVKLIASVAPIATYAQADPLLS